jgi:hypothetical protein
LEYCFIFIENTRIKKKMNNWGGKRANSGRPKGALGKGEKKTGRIVISCLESEEAEIKRLAESSGKTVSRYLVDLALGK